MLFDATRRGVAAAVHQPPPGQILAAEKPARLAAWLGCRRPGGIQPDKLRGSYLGGPLAGRGQFGAFSLAYVTYAFALNASRGLATYPLQVRFSGVAVAAWRRAVAGSTGTATVVGVVTGACVLGGRLRCFRADPGRLPRAGADAARAVAARQLAVLVLHPRPGQPGLPQRRDLGGGAVPGAACCSGSPATKTSSGSSSPGAPRRRRRGRGRCRPGSSPRMTHGGSGVPPTATSARATRAGHDRQRSSQLRTRSGSSWAWPRWATCRPPSTLMGPFMLIFYGDSPGDGPGGGAGTAALA